MADILAFPSQQAQALAYLDRELRNLLQTRGADQALVDFAADQLTSLYRELNESEHYQLKINLPAGLAENERAALYAEIEQGLGEVQRENHQLLVRLVARLVLTELRLFQHERPDA